jgi:choline-sulfatase
MIRSFLVCCLMINGAAIAADAARPNVLFIAIDDQNDWIGAFGGHPLAKTPQIDRLAASGTVFLNAHCQAPLCNPSRTSLMLGVRPTTTGVYGLVPWFRTLNQWKDRVTLPQYFHEHGYRTLTVGKIHHGGGGGPQERAREFDVWGAAGGVGVKPDQKLIPPTPMACFLIAMKTRATIRWRVGRSIRSRRDRGISRFS